MTAQEAPKFPYAHAVTDLTRPFKGFYNSWDLDGIRWAEVADTLTSVNRFHPAKFAGVEANANAFLDGMNRYLFQRGTLTYLTTSLIDDYSRRSTLYRDSEVRKQVLALVPLRRDEAQRLLLTMSARRDIDFFEAPSAKYFPPDHRISAQVQVMKLRDLIEKLKEHVSPTDPQTRR